MTNKTQAGLTNNNTNVICIILRNKPTTIQTKIRSHYNTETHDTRQQDSVALPRLTNTTNRRAHACDQDRQRDTNKGTNMKHKQTAYKENITMKQIKLRNIIAYVNPFLQESLYLACIIANKFRFPTHPQPGTSKPLCAGRKPPMTTYSTNSTTWATHCCTPKDCQRKMKTTGTHTLTISKPDTTLIHNYPTRKICTSYPTYPRTLSLTRPTYTTENHCSRWFVATSQPGEPSVPPRLYSNGSKKAYPFHSRTHRHPSSTPKYNTHQKHFNTGTPNSKTTTFNREQSS